MLSHRLVKKFLAFFRSRGFITVFASVRQWTPVLSPINPIHIVTPHFFQTHFNAILPSIQRLQSGIFPSRISAKILCVFLISFMLATCPPILSLKTEIKTPNSRLMHCATWPWNSVIGFLENLVSATYICTTFPLSRANLPD